MLRLIKLLWSTFVLVTPLLGVWLSSSLASYVGGPRWAAIAAGALLFPVLPVLWEARATHRSRKKNARRAQQGKAEKKRWGRATDRLIARTLTVNLGFLAVLVGLFPAATFPALSTRGAWFLDDNPAPYAAPARRAVFAVAEKLEWLYGLTHDNPFTGQRESEDTGPQDPTPPPPPPVKRPAPEDQPAPALDRRPAWPLPAEIDARAQNVPASSEASIAALGAHLKTIQPAFARIKVMHDWVADHIAYDWPSVEDRSYMTKQSAQQVFATRRGVCSGYSNLMVALGKVTGDRIVYVAGDARDENGGVDAAGHAWNAVEVDDHWYLLDVTWDGGKQIGREDGPYRTTYFMAPPAAFGLDHFPDQPKWQLVSPPLSRGAFLRQPTLRPEFVAEGLSLISPDTGLGLAQKSARIAIGNPQGRYLLGKISPEQGGPERDCRVTPGRRVFVDCDVDRGRSRVRLFSHDKPAGRFGFVGTVFLERR